MSNESKNSNDSAVPQSQQSEPQTPRTFPKSNYIRPGIDDRPDLDKALSAEDKSAVARLAVRQKPVTAPPAATHPEVQAAALADAAGLSHPASDEPIPDVESAFFDLRDPM
ncbi:MFS transporter, partial [Bifidobacterium animalis subsp. lactis]